MREDMFKVIVERPRSGMARRHKRRKFSGEDTLAAKIGMKRHVAVAGVRSKRSNENLKPLERFLRSQLRRRWDDVYSDIAATLDPGHTVIAKRQLSRDALLAHGLANSNN